MNLKRLRTPFLWAIGSIALFLLLIEFVLSPVLRWKMNQDLAKMPDHWGTSESVDIKFWRAEVCFNDFQMYQKSRPKNLPVFHTKVLGVRPNWSSLGKGKFELNLSFDAPDILFIQDITFPSGLPKSVAKKKIKSWIKVLEEIMPVDVRNVSIADGTFIYRIPQDGKDLRVVMRDFFAHVENLTLAQKKGGKLPGTAWMYGKTSGDGSFKVTSSFDAVAKPPAFNMKLELQHVNLVSYNSFFKHYAGFDLESGKFDLSSEASSKHNLIIGEAVPVFSNIIVVGPHDKSENVFHRIWEGLVGVAVDTLKNTPQDQIAKKVEIKGKLDDPEMDIWDALGSTVKESVVQSIAGSYKK